MSELKKCCEYCRDRDGIPKYFCVFKRDGLYQVSFCCLELREPLDYNSALDLFDENEHEAINNSATNSTTIGFDSPICDWFFSQKLTCFGSCGFEVEVTVLGDIYFNKYNVPFV